jgi:riboflavin biosynthesis pyrimidine reductase
MRRLHPTPAIDVTVEEAYAAPLGPPTTRPWVGLTMVTSLDGSTVVAGRSGGLSNPNDSAVLSRLRALADVIVVGAGTVRAEGYGPPKKPGQRIGVVTATGHVDLTTDLFRSGSGFVITTEVTPIADDRVDVVRAGRDGVDLAAALAGVEELCRSVAVVQAEGGPSLNGALLEADLIDEIDVTTAPLVVAGEGPRLAKSPGAVNLRFELAQLLLDDDGFTFARWRRRDR